MKRFLLKCICKLRSGIFQMLSANVINKIIGLTSTMLITRLLSPDEYGIWSYVLNLYSYLQLVKGWGLDSGVLQFGAEHKGEGKAFSFLRYGVQKGSLINLLTVMAVGMGIWLHDLPIDGSKPYVLAILPLLLLEFAMTMGLIALRTQNRIREYALVLNVNSILLAAGNCGGALFGIGGVVVGRYLAAAVCLLYLGKLLWTEIQHTRQAARLDRADTRQLWHYSLFTGASSAMNCLVYSIDVTFIAALLKNAMDVSIYRVGTLIPNALQFIPTSVVTAVLTTIIYHQSQPEWIKAYLKKIYLGLTAANAGICVVLYAFAPWIVRIVSGEAYLASAPVLRVLTLGYFFSGTFRALSVNLLAAFKRVRFGLFISIASCVVDVVFNYVLIGRFGMMGAAYATLLVDMVTAALSFGYVLILLKKGLQPKTN